MSELQSMNNPESLDLSQEQEQTVPAPTGLPRRVNRGHLVQDNVTATAVARKSPKRLERARELAIASARIADDNRGKEILVLDLGVATSIVDFFVIVTAASRRQSNAIASEIDAEMKQSGELKLGREGTEEGRWVLIDYGDFVVHVLSEEARKYYALEEIWGDATHIEWVDPSKPLQRKEVRQLEDTLTDADVDSDSEE